MNKTPDANSKAALAAAVMDAKFAAALVSEMAFIKTMKELSDACTVAIQMSEKAAEIAVKYEDWDAWRWHKSAAAKAEQIRNIISAREIYGRECADRFYP